MKPILIVGLSIISLIIPAEPIIIRDDTVKVDVTVTHFEPIKTTKYKKLVNKTTIAEKPHTEPSMQSGGEKAVYIFLIKHFTKAQAAGIMGNLRQEHNYQTSGDGIAQWTGNRKARLLGMSNPYSLNTQLNFMLIEMKEMNLKLPDNVVGATLTFQNQFERCGDCKQSQRIRYAQDIYNRY